MKITKTNLNLLIERFLFENDDEEEKAKQDFLDAASHQARYGKNLNKKQLAYLNDPGRKPNRTLYLDPEENEQDEEILLRKFKTSDVLMSNTEDEINQSIYDMVYDNTKRIKALEDKYQMLIGNFKVIDMSTKDNKDHIIRLDKDIIDLANLFNPQTKESQ